MAAAYSFSGLFSEPVYSVDTIAISGFTPAMQTAVVIPAGLSGRLSRPDALAEMNALGDGEKGDDRRAWRDPGERGDDEEKIVAGAGDVADARDVTVDGIAAGAGAREAVVGDFEAVAEQLDEADLAEGRSAGGVEFRGHLLLIVQDGFAGGSGAYGHQVDPVGPGAKLDAGDSVVAFGDGFPARGEFDGEAARGVLVEIGEVSVGSGVFLADEYAYAAAAVLLREGADKARLIESESGFGFGGLRRGRRGMADESKAGAHGVEKGKRLVVARERGDDGEADEEIVRGKGGEILRDCRGFGVAAGADGGERGKTGEGGGAGLAVEEGGALTFEFITVGINELFRGHRIALVLLRDEDRHRDGAVAKRDQVKAGFRLNLPTCGNLEGEAAVGTGVESLRGGGEGQEERCNRKVAKEVGWHGRSPWKKKGHSLTRQMRKECLPNKMDAGPTRDGAKTAYGGSPHFTISSFFTSSEVLIRRNLIGRPPTEGAA